MDVLDAEQEVLNAKLSVLEAQHTLNAATFQLLTTLGVSDVEGLRLSVDSYDPADNFETVKYQGMTAIADRYVPEIIHDAVDEIEKIPNSIGKAAKSLVKPSNASDLSVGE